MLHFLWEILVNICFAYSKSFFDKISDFSTVFDEGGVEIQTVPGGNAEINGSGVFTLNTESFFNNHAQFKKVTINTNDNLILLIDKKSNIDFLNLSKPENKFLQTQLKNKKELIYINQYNRWIQFICPKKISSSHLHLENCRLLGDKSLNNIAATKSLLIINFGIFF